MTLPNPTLVCEFARTKRLPANITFNRASSATYTDSNGIVRYADSGAARFDHTPNDGTSNGLLIEESRTNLLPNSSDFTASSWNRGNLTISSNSNVAPDGTYTADKMVETTTASASHNVSPTATVTNGLSYTYSMFVKSGERTKCIVGFDTTLFGSFQYVLFDLSTGTSSAFLGSPTSSISAYPNGWYRISVTATATTSSTGISGSIQTHNGTSNTYTGDGSSGLYIWGAQLEQASFASSYIPSVETFTSRASTATYFDSTDGLLKVTPTNLLTYSQDFTNAVWAKGNLLAFSSTGSLANIAIAPNGTQTASKLVESTATGFHTLSITNTTLTAGQYITSSIYVKAGERTYFESVFFIDGTHWVVPTVNLTTGTVTATNTLNMPAGTYSTSVIDAGYGWKRIVTSFTVPVTSSTSYIENRILNNSAVSSYSGDGTSGLYVWGAQVNLGQLQTYSATTSTAITSGGSRQHYNQYSKVSNGILLEPAATNLLTYSEQFDNAFWIKFNSTVTSNQTTAPDGTLTADKLVDNTTNIQHNISISRTGSNETLTFSIFAKAAELTSIFLQLSNNVNATAQAAYSLLDGSISQISAANADYSNIAAYSIAYPNGWYRCILTATKAAVNTTNVPAVTTMSGSSITYVGTGTGIYIWGAQLETGSSATSYIPTIASTVTRAADTGSSTSATRVAEQCYINRGPWFNQSEGTIYVTNQMKNLTSGYYPRVIQIEGVDSNIDYLTVHYPNSLTGYAIDNRANAASTFYVNNTITSGSTNTMAVGYKSNDCAITVNGAVVTTDTSVTLITNPTKMVLGSTGSFAVGAYLNGTISKLYYWPKRLSNTDLQNISGI